MASSHRRFKGQASKFPRTARINELLREVIATELERVADDDPRLELVTVTAVNIETDLRHATVFFSALDTKADLKEVGEALDQKRKMLQALIGRDVRMKNTPQLSFMPDSGIIEGQRIEDILGAIPPAMPNPVADAFAAEEAAENTAEGAND